MASERFYIDCEFDGHSGPLLSMAMISEDGFGLHVITDAEASDEWVVANIVPLIDRHDADMEPSGRVPVAKVGTFLRRFIGDCQHPVIVADSPVDIGRFCTALSTGADGGWASADYPMMTFEVHNVDCWPNDIPGAIQHNAYWDAMALRHALAEQPA